MNGIEEREVSSAGMLQKGMLGHHHYHHHFFTYHRHLSILHFNPVSNIILFIPNPAFSFSSLIIAIILILIYSIITPGHYHHLSYLMKSLSLIHPGVGCGVCSSSKRELQWVWAIHQGTMGVSGLPGQGACVVGSVLSVCLLKVRSGQWGHHHTKAGAEEIGGGHSRLTGDRQWACLRAGPSVSPSVCLSLSVCPAMVVCLSPVPFPGTREGLSGWLVWLAGFCPVILSVSPPVTHHNWAVGSVSWHVKLVQVSSVWGPFRLGQLVIGLSACRLKNRLGGWSLGHTAWGLGLGSMSGNIRRREG